MGQATTGESGLDVYKDWLGIPEGERPPDHYQLLRLVRFEDDLEKIREHYTKLNAHVRKYATGQYSAQSQELLNELAKAMLCLTDPQRKREYDESLGREFDDAGEIDHKTTEKILVEQGHITAEQAQEAERFAELRGLSMRDAVVQMKLVDNETATKALAEELRLPYVDLSETVPDDSVLDRVPRNLVKRNSILPLFIDDETLLVACADEPTPELEDELRLRFGLPMKGALAMPRAINQGIAKYYAPGMRDESAVEEVSKTAKRKGGAHQPRKRTSQLSPDEAAQRKQYGILFICWGVIIPVLLDQFLLKPYVLPDALSFSYVPSLGTLILTPTVIWYVLKVYWK